MFIDAIVQIPKEIGLWAKTMLVLLQTTAYGQKDHTHTWEDRFLANGSLVFRVSTTAGIAVSLQN